MAEFKRAQVCATTIAVTCLAAMVVVLRFIARYMTVKSKLTPDDWLTVVAMILTFCSMAANLIMINTGLGQNIFDISRETTARLMQIVLIDEYIYIINLTIIKLSILFMYRRLFPTRTIRVATGVLGGISITWALTYVVIVTLQCMPLRKWWQPGTEGTCLDLRAIYLGNAIPNILTDISILALPITQVWRLQVKLWQRIVLIGIFFLGSFVVFISIYRLILLLQIDPTNVSRSLEPALTWAHIEMATAVISASLPIIRPVCVYICRCTGLSKFVSSIGGLSRGISLPEQTNRKTTETAPPSSRASINLQESDWICLDHSTKETDVICHSCVSCTGLCRKYHSSNNSKTRPNITKTTEIHHEYECERREDSDRTSQKQPEIQVYSIV